VVGVEPVNSNLGGGTDTLSYAGTAAANGVIVNLGAATPTDSDFGVAPHQRRSLRINGLMPSISSKPQSTCRLEFILAASISGR
jgi:hypothetical protein